MIMSKDTIAQNADYVGQHQQTLKDLWDNNVKDTKTSKINKETAYKEEHNHVIDLNEEYGDNIQKLFLEHRVQQGTEDEKKKQNKRTRTSHYHKRSHIKPRVNRPQGIINTAITEMVQKIRKKRAQMDDQDLAQMDTYWGDHALMQKGWPEINTQGTIRIAAINKHGITMKYDFLEWELLLTKMAELQIDILLINEANLNLRSGTVRDKLKCKARYYDVHMKLIMNSANITAHTQGTIYRPGGTMILVRGAWSGRVEQIEEPSSKDRCGRWSVAHLKCKGNKYLSIISIYRVTKQAANSGNDTIYQQQQHDLMRLSNSVKMIDPRQQYYKDLKQYITDLHNLNHNVIIAGDVNEDLSKTITDYRSLIEVLNMKDIMTEKHHAPLPTTYDRGRCCLDAMGCSERIEPHIIRCGFFPFYTIYSDHRMMFCDIDIHKVFGKFKEDNTKITNKTFHSKNVERADKYLQHLEELIDSAKIKQQMRSIIHQIKNRHNTPINIPATVKKLQNLHKKMTEYMKAASKKCGRTCQYKLPFPGSIALTNAADNLYQAKKAMRKLHLGLENTLTYEELKERIEFAQEDLKCLQQNAKYLRRQQLQTYAERVAPQWNQTTEQAVKVLLDIEDMKCKYGTIGSNLNRNTKSALRHILVPAPMIFALGEGIGEEHFDEYNPKYWTRIDDFEEIQRVILRRNARHLMKSSTAITATGPLHDELGIDADNKTTTEQILNGTYDYNKLNKAYPDIGMEASEFIRAMRKPLTDADLHMEWQFGTEEYKTLFTKTRETTVCGPSGLHMSHWVVAANSDTVSEVHAGFIWAAFELGFAYTRWCTSYHSMIKKKQLPFYDKLRIVQLFEGDFNGALKYLLGRVLMRHIVNNKLSPDQTYGSVPGRTAQEAMIMLQLLFDNHRQFKKSLIAIFNDADGCYDRIRANQGELAMRRHGVSETLARAHTITQRKMRHYIKTSSGISMGYIEWSPSEELLELTVKTTQDNREITIFKGNIGGIGQGGGGGPVIWLTILIVLIQAYTIFTPGATLIDPFQEWMTQVRILSYVDDNTILRTIDNKMMPAEIFAVAAKDLRHWQNLLKATGGDLSLSKCTISILKWRWTSDGYPKMDTKMTLPGTVIITDQKGGESRLQRLEPHMAERQLGIRLAMNGSYKQEYKFRKHQCDTLGEKLYRSHLNHYNAYLVYSVYYTPMITYPLQVTTFTDIQCDDIQRKFIYYLLPKIGLNRHMPRDIIYGPTKFGGAGIRDLKVIQLHEHLYSLKAHIRRNDAVGRGYMANIAAMHMEAGTEHNIFSRDPNYYCYLEKTKLQYIWQKARQYNISIEVTRNNPIVKLKRYTKDICLMDYAVTTNYCKKNPVRLKAINHVRIFLRIIWMSDMLSADETTIHPGHYFYTHTDITPPLLHPDLIFPEFPSPTRTQWSIWHTFLGEDLIRYIPGHRGHVLQLTYNLGGIVGNKTIIPSEIEQLRNLQPGTTLQDTFDRVPYPFNIILNCPSLPSDNGKALMTALQNNQGRAACDGSLIPGTDIGTYAYLLTDVKMEHSITGKSYTPVTEKMSSLISEQYGWMGVLLTTYVLCKHHGYSGPPQQCKLETAIDNETQLQRGNQRANESIHLKTYIRADWDVWKMNDEIRSLISVILTTTHVKSHQDTKIPYDQLPLEAQLNIQADQLASQQYMEPNPHFHKPTFSTAGIIYRDMTGQEITDTYRYINDKEHSKRIKNYLQTRRQWDDTTMTSICWDALEKAQHLKKPLQRIKFTQTIHGWQHVGYQKAQFNNQEAEIHDYHCPFDCGEIESQLHYIQCPKVLGTKEHIKCLDTLRQQLISLNTAPNILTTILHAARNLDRMDQFQHTRGDPISKATKQQEQVGWIAFFQGFISWEWLSVQYHTQPETPLTTRIHWASKVICAMHEYVGSLWQLRNSNAHDGPNNTNNIGLRKLQRYADRLYDHEDRKYIPIFNNVFQRPREHLYQKKLTSLQTWVGLAEEQLKQGRNAYLQTLRKQIQILFSNCSLQDQNNKTSVFIHAESTVLNMTIPDQEKWIEDAKQCLRLNREEAMRRTKPTWKIKKP